MNIGYGVFEYITLTEVVIIVLIVFSTYALLLISNIKNKHKKRIESDIENYFNTLIHKDKQFSFNAFPKKWKKLQILYPLMQKMNEIYADNDTWQSIRQNVFQFILLPLAREAAYSGSWVNRLIACQIFELVAEKNDKKTIIKLANDKIPLVFIHSIPAVVKCPSEEAITAIIKRMSHRDWLAQPIYLEKFRQAPIEILPYIKETLEKAKNPETKAVCYNILRQFPSQRNFVDAKKDLSSTSFELRLATIKYISYTEEEAAIPILLESLKDHHWEVRLVALHRLGALRVHSSIQKIAECLHDQVGWVKNSAAEALKSFGEDGEEILKANAIELDPIPFEATKHIKNTLW